jgi:hypothetical protein
MYAGDPFVDFIEFPEPEYLDKPKSEILRTSPFTRILLGLISLDYNKFTGA